MAYKCVHCSTLYEDGSKEIISGCSECKRKFFFYIKDDQLKIIQARKEEEKEEPIFNEEERQQIEDDVRDITGITDQEKPVFLDFESVRVQRHGKYLLDLPKLFSGKPQVYQLENGKYIVDFSSLNKKDKKGKK